MLREGFTMDDLLNQMNQIRKMGGLAKLISALPGGDRMMAQQGELARNHHFLLYTRPQSARQRQKTPTARPNTPTPR